MDQISVEQYELVYNFFSFTIAAMGAATAFLWLNRSQVASYYRPALTISGLVTFIALYHYVRIFQSWEGAYGLSEVSEGMMEATSKKFNEAYRYVDWLLTVPLLLIELILVMKLTKSETVSKSVRLGTLAALMILLGYPGEISNVASTQWLWWALSMIPFLWIMYELFVGLSSSLAAQPTAVRGLVSRARLLTVLAWSFYPIVYILQILEFDSATATTAVQVGYTIADIVAKAVFGIVIYRIAVAKTEAEAAA
jgi:bacteriorhodopsin